MQHFITRLTLSTALLIGAALPALAQGNVPAAGGPRAAVVSPTVPATPTTPGVSTSQAARPATPTQPGGNVQHTAPRPAATAPVPSGHQQAATPARPVTPRAN